MQERRVRLGDILDDYCPRERRITNHAVVAMIDNEVKQTRCVTCEAEHPYRGARVPTRRRKADTAEALMRQVLASRAKTESRAADERPVEAPESSETQRAAPEPLSDAVSPGLSAESAAAAAPPDAAAADGPLVGHGHDGEADRDEGPVHRPLIRATLPRPEGQQPARPIPQFTIRQLPGHKRLSAFRDPKRAPWASDNGPPPGPASRFPGSFRRGLPDRAVGARGRPGVRPDKKRSR